MLEVVAPGRVVAALARAGAGNALLTFAPAGPGTPWHATGFAAVLPGLSAELRRWLGVRERRVVASLVVLGYAARLLGPPVAVLLRDGVLVDIRPPAVRFGFAAGQGFRLALAEPAGWTGPPDALAARLRRDLIDDHLTAVLTAVRLELPVSAGLLWGNVASGLVGALAALAGSGTVAPARCAAFARAALAGGPLAGAGELRFAGDRLAFRRRSCCLYYRLPGGGYCGDCCFDRKAA